MRNHRWARLALALCSTAVAGSLRAGEIAGAARDASGGMLPAATITLENAATGARSSRPTGSDGRYSFSPVGVGTYRVSAALAGFSEQSRTVSIASEGERVEVDFVLALGSLSTTVTVTASRGARDGLVVPLRTDNIGRAQLEVDNPTSTGDAMLRAPGITPVGSGPFQVRPRLRGLDSTRVLLLVDGERLNNARTATDRAGVEVGLVDVANVESIEVVSGSGSVLYGTDALSGTINVITAQPSLTGPTRFSGGLDGFYSSNADGWRGTATAGLSGSRVALRASATRERFDEYRSGGRQGEVLEDSRALFASGRLRQADTIDDSFGFSFKSFPDPFNAPYVRRSREVPNSGFEGQALHVAASLAFSDDQSLRLRYVRRRASDIGFPDFAAPYFFQGIVLPRSDLDKASARYHLRAISSWFSSLAVTGYYQRQNRLLQNVGIPVQFPAPTPQTLFPINVFRLLIDSSTEQDVRTPGFDFQATFQLSHRNVLTAGATVYRDRSEDTRLSSSQLHLVGNVALGARGPQANVLPALVALGPPTVTRPVRVPDSSFRDVGVFVQDEWDLGARIRLVAGLRRDFYRVQTDATPGYDVESLIRGAAPALDPRSFPDVRGNSFSRKALTGDLGLVVRASDAVSLLAHYGRSYRHPNLEELLFAGPATIGSIVPNLRVKPEKGHNLDLGVRLRSGRMAASLSCFDNRYDGFISTEIVSRTPSTTLSQAINFADVRIRGVEGDLEAPFTAGAVLVTVFGGAAYNHGQVLRGTSPLTRASLDDTPQDNITPFKATAGLRISDRKSRVWAEYSARTQSKVKRVAPTLIDSPFLIAQDIYGLNGFTIERASAGVDWRKDAVELGLSVALENLTNSFYREQFQFAPARGRSLVVGLHVRRP